MSSYAYGPTTGHVHFQSSNGLSLVVLLDDSAAGLTGGFGGWEVVDRPKRVGMVRFKGRDPFRQDVPIIFDGYADDVSVENDINTLSRMAEFNVGGEPPDIKLNGAVQRTDLLWVIETIDWDKQKVIWDNNGSDFFRLRQAAIVHLLQKVNDHVIITPPALKVITNKTSGKTKPASGKTARQEAQIEYGSPDFWTLILDANPWITDPRAPITKGDITFPPLPRVLW